MRRRVGNGVQLIMADGVSLQDVAKSFSDVTGIPKLNLDVKEREIAVLAGTSGCGKSPALRAIAGVEKVSGSSIFIAGRDATCERPVQRDIAMAFQSCTHCPHENVGENMSFALRPAWVSKEEVAERVRRAAEMLELTPYFDWKPKDLSGGRRHRVAMGRESVRDAYCFLFDEPLSNFDARLRASKGTELSLLHKKPVVQ